MKDNRIQLYISNLIEIEEIILELAKILKLKIIRNFFYIKIHITVCKIYFLKNKNEISKKLKYLIIY